MGHSKRTPYSLRTIDFLVWKQLIKTRIHAYIRKKKSFKNLDTNGIYKKSLKNLQKSCWHTFRIEYSYVFRGERQVARSGETAKPHYISNVKGECDALWLQCQKGLLLGDQQREFGTLKPSFSGTLHRSVDRWNGSKRRNRSFGFGRRRLQRAPCLGVRKATAEAQPWRLVN